MDVQKQYFIAQEDTNIYNVFDYDEFDSLDDANEWLDDVNEFYN